MGFSAFKNKELFKSDQSAFASFLYSFHQQLLCLSTAVPLLHILACSQPAG
jgi:hypothetical protein